MISRAEYEAAREVLTGRPRQIARIGGRSFRTLESLDRFAIKEGLEDGGIVPTQYDDPRLRGTVVAGEQGAEIFVQDSSKIGQPKEASEASQSKPKPKRAATPRKRKAKSQEAAEKPARRTRRAAKPADEASETSEAPPEP